MVPIKVCNNIYISNNGHCMRKNKTTPTTSPTSHETRTWYAFEGPLGDVIHNGRFFFAWKEGCLMGTYNTLEEATASLTSGEARETH